MIPEVLIAILVKAYVVQRFRVIKKCLPQIFRAEDVYLSMGRPDLPNHRGNLRNLLAMLSFIELML